MTECEEDGCENKATGVYEAIVPPAGTTRYAACWEHSPQTTPARYINAGADGNAGK